MTVAIQADERNKGVIFKSPAPFVNCKSEIDNVEVGNAKAIDIRIPMYYLIEYSDNFKDFVSFKSKIKTTGNTSANGNTKDVEMIVPLKYLNNSWRALQMPLLNCEIKGTGRFAITDAKLMFQ